MAYLVYKTINLVNGKHYIGAHTGERNDAYLGSGKALKAAIRKYGIENFKREILFEVASADAMYAKEAELVVLGPESYNLRKGGMGGWDYCNTPEGIERRAWTFVVRGRAGAKKVAEKIKNDPLYAKQYHLRCHDASKKNPAKFTGYEFLGKKHTDETKRRMSVSQIGKHEGKKNSQYETCWIWHSELGNRKIPNDQLSEMLLRGFCKGRKMGDALLIQ